jgi:superfamily II DNA or RNA helicase
MIRKIDPERGYRKEHLWLPLSKIGSVNAVRNSLTFPLEQAVPVHAYEMTSSHILVPREYIPLEQWETLDFAIEDHTRTSFPRVQVSATSPLRDEVQEAGYRALLNGGNGILTLSCGKGKTVVSLVAWTKLEVPLLVIVHTQELMNQWKERIVEHTTIRSDQIGTYRGKIADWEHPVCVAMIQTLASRMQEEALPEGFEEHFGVVIYDEVHHLGAPYFNTTAAVGAGLRWGLSATPEREDGLDGLYQAHIGPILYENLDHEVIPEIYFVYTGVHVPEGVWPQLRDRTGDVNIPKLMTWLSKHDLRNAKIVETLNFAVGDGRKILALSARVDHIDEMAAIYGDTASKIHGTVKDSERRGALTDKDLIFASTQIAKEGLDRKDLDTIMLLLPITKETMFRQILGRIQRKDENKATPAMIIFEDENIPICRNMCNKLRRHLLNLQYPYYFDKD